jgi:Gas vesicle synthesis protein GvpO
VAESKSKGGRSKRSSSSSRTSSKGGSSRNGRSRKQQSPREIVGEAIKQVHQLIGRPIESVTGVEKNGSEWNVTLEVLELERVPNTTDILGRYEVTLDKNGGLTGVQRTRRYSRAEAGED